MKLLLHACCGPCSLEPTRLLRAAGHDLTIFYANSNISPDEEYEQRVTTLREWAKGEELPVVEGVRDTQAWEQTAGRIGDAALAEVDESEEFPALAVDPAKREARCRACYRLRFEEAACEAATHGYEGIGTTLSVSPYQYTQVIREELERAATPYGLEALFKDFRPYYNEATRRSRELGMYRQNYCGCRFSDAEAAAERELRKRERAQAREEERAAHAAEQAAEEAQRAARKAERAAYDQKQAQKRAILKALREKENNNA